MFETTLHVNKVQITRDDTASKRMFPVTGVSKNVTANFETLHVIDAQITRDNEEKVAFREYSTLPLNT